MSLEGKVVLPRYTKDYHQQAYPAIDPTNPANSVAGRIVLVTGGNSGIGRGIAKAFAQAGAKAVVIVGRQEKTLQEAKSELESEGSSKVLAFAADVLDTAALDRAFETTAKEVGKVDIVASNAGYLPGPSSIAAADPADWWRGFEVNVQGAFNVFRAWMKQKGTNKPTFISTNTVAAHAGAFPNFSGYSCSKIALAQLISCLQVENPDVRFVSMYPGAIETAMYAKSAIPMEIDNVNLPSSFEVWLASAAEDWVKGRFLWANWDVEELGAMKDDIVKNNELVLGLTGWPKLAP